MPVYFTKKKLELVPKLHTNKINWQTFKEIINDNIKRNESLKVIEENRVQSFTTINQGRSENNTTTKTTTLLNIRKKIIGKRNLQKISRRTKVLTRLHED